MFVVTNYCVRFFIPILEKRYTTVCLTKMEYSPLIKAQISFIQAIKTWTGRLGWFVVDLFACLPAGSEPGCYRSVSLLNCHCGAPCFREANFLFFFSENVKSPAQKLLPLTALADIFSRSRMHSCFITEAVSLLPHSFFFLFVPRKANCSCFSGSGIQAGLFHRNLYFCWAALRGSERSCQVSASAIVASSHGLLWPAQEGVPLSEHSCTFFIISGAEC